MDDDDKARKARRKFWAFRGPVSEETKEKLRQSMREFHVRTRRGTELGNLMARAARLKKVL